MAITWRPAVWSDIEPSLLIGADQTWGLPGVKSHLDFWKHLLRDPYFSSAVIESNPPIGGHRLLGFGSAVLVTSKFADAEVANPRPHIAARIMRSVAEGRPVLASWNEVARANAGEGVDVAVVYNAWRDEILNAEQKQDVETLFASSFMEVLAGFRVRRIIAETTCEAARDFYARSVVYRAIAEFPELGRVIHLMTRDSVRAVPASMGNVIFKFHEPVLRLRDAEQRMLLAALNGATDVELAVKLGVTYAAVKARWRSTFARIAEPMPGLVSDFDDREGRGAQKRHRVLAYVRNHMEELRPYDWKAKSREGRVFAVVTTKRTLPVRSWLP